MRVASVSHDVRSMICQFANKQGSVSEWGEQEKEARVEAGRGKATCRAKEDLVPL